MKKIVEKLMDYGMSYEYEHRGSMGEKIISYELAIEVISQEGKIYFSFEGETETLPDEKKSYTYISMRIEQICIDETASF